jgi:membrane protease YdiL (CAAX protease family)
VSLPPDSGRETLPAAPAVPLPRALGGFALDLVLAVVLALGAMFACGLVWAVVEGIRAAWQSGAAAPDLAAIARPGILAQLWFTVLGTGAAALALYFFRRHASTAEYATSLAATRRPGTWGWALAAGLGSFAFTVAATQLGIGLGIEPDPSNLVLIRQALVSHPLFLTLFVIVLAPAYEELLFRRVLFGRLWAAGWPWLGMVLSGAAFAIAHELPGTTGKGALATAFLLLIYTLMGMLFAWVYRRTGTLWAPLAAHALNNALALVALRMTGAA